VRLSRAEIYLLPPVLLGTGALAFLAYRIVGFLGIGILGVLIGFIAVRVDLEKDGGRQRVGGRSSRPASRQPAQCSPRGARSP
jgi:hypothetical protein